MCAYGFGEEKKDLLDASRYKRTYEKNGGLKEAFSNLMYLKRQMSKGKKLFKKVCEKNSKNKHKSINSNIPPISTLHLTVTPPSLLLFLLVYLEPPHYHCHPITEPTNVE